VDVVIGDPGEHVGKPGLGIDIIELGVWISCDEASFPGCFLPPQDKATGPRAL
jgi:hypothetical protein